MNNETNNTLTKAERKRIMSFILQAGTVLLKNGAEVFRVEQTMQHMALGFGLTNFNAYVLTNGIFASEEKAEYSQLRNIPRRTIHLGRVAAVNELSRNISQHLLTIDEAEKILDSIKEMSFTSHAKRLLAYACGSLCFCALYGGNFLDSLVSSFAGIILGTYLIYCEKRESTSLFRTFTGATLVSFICFSLNVIYPLLNANHGIIGAYMILTPGIALTMSIRDIVQTDYLSGIIRMVDALLVAAAIACGTGLSLMLQRVLVEVI